MKEEQQALWEPGGTEARTAAGTARRYRKPLGKLCASDLRVLLADTYEEWYKHKAPRLSAALAFYTALSLAPLLIVVIAVAGFFFGQQAAQGQIVWQIEGLVGHTSAVAIEGMIEGARKPVTGSLAAMLGIALLLFTATTVVAELRDAPAAGQTEFAKIHRLNSASWTANGKIYILAGKQDDLELKQYLD